MESFELREYDQVIERWTVVDPKRLGWSPYIGMFNNPTIETDPDGGGPPDYYEENATGKVVWIEGSGVVEGYTHLSANSLDPSVINAVSADISNRGFDAFLNYFNDPRFGGDYFFDLAHTMEFQRDGWLSGLIDTSLPVSDAFYISEWTHGKIANNTDANNALEHHIGTFLMTSRWGPGSAAAVTTANEVRGLLINDRQSGNFWNALLGRPGTAFEWKDLSNNLDEVASK